MFQKWDSLQLLYLNKRQSHRTLILQYIQKLLRTNDIVHKNLVSSLADAAKILRKKKNGRSVHMNIAVYLIFICIIELRRVMD